MTRSSREARIAGDGHYLLTQVIPAIAFALMAKLQAEIKKRRPFESPSEEAYLNLVRTYGVLEADFVRLFKQHGISEPKYNVLRILRGAGGDGLPSLEIVSRMITRVPDVTRIVERERTTADLRVVLVSITRKGLDLLAKLDEPTKQIHCGQLQHLSKAELAELSRLLEKARTPAGGE
jgi:DNA-binding MarR family transcriptional regulator